MIPRTLRFLLVSSLFIVTACSNDPAGGSGEDGTAVGGDVGTDGLFTLPDGAVVDSLPGADGGATPLDVTLQDGGGGQDTGGGGGGEVLGRFDDCGWGNPCPEPLVCVGSCQLPCDAGCPDDEECIELRDDFGVCGHVVGEGGECDFERARVCEEGLFCNEDGICEAPEVSGEGDPCGGDELTCEEGLVCVSTGWNEGVCLRACDPGCEEDEICVTSGDGGSGVCFLACDPEDPDDSCPEGYVCREQRGGGDVACLPDTGGGGGGGGETPGDLQYAAECSGWSSCEGDLWCPPIDGAYCTPTCNETSDCPSDPPGATCESFGWGPGLCLYVCEGGGECPETCDGDPDCTDMACGDVWGMMLCHY